MKALNMLMGIVGTAAYYEQSYWLTLVAVALLLVDFMWWYDEKTAARDYVKFAYGRRIGGERE